MRADNDQLTPEAIYGIATIVVIGALGVAAELAKERWMAPRRPSRKLGEK